MEGQVALLGIASDDQFGFVSDSCQEHQHLVRCAVLHFICNDKGFFEGSSSHVGKGGDFNDAFLNHGFNHFEGHHFVEQVKKGPRPGFHFSG